MHTTVELIAVGPEPAHRRQQTLHEDVTVRIGRAVERGCSISWDRLVSREHADVVWRAGKLHVSCLSTARNSLTFRGQQFRELEVSLGEQFEIGQTRFEVRDAPGEQEEFGVAVDGAARHHAYSHQELKQFSFGNSQRQLESLANLPRLISSSQTDEELGKLLADLLLSAIPHAEAVAVANFNVDELPNEAKGLDRFPKPLALCVATRDDYNGRFSPSRRLILRTLREQDTVLHIWDPEGASEKFTVSDDLGWAFCAPIQGEACLGWCLYVSGRGAEQRSGLLLTEKDLLGDLRFTELVAQFIGSIRQVRMLQEHKTQLSTFFSPKVIANLTNRESKTSLTPSERDITVLFCDLRGFSRKSEKLQDDLLSLLNSVSSALGVMVNGILQSDGAIADFQGDAALGFWGWPVSLEEGPVPACIAALTIQAEFRRSLGDRAGLLADFSVGIGIAHGRALAGRIGTTQQSKVGVFGPVVNQGSRLEGLTKQFAVPICIDETTDNFARRYMPSQAGRCRRLARVRPVGMSAPITVSALLPTEEEYPETSDQMILDYEFALNDIIDGRWSDALPLLSRLPESDGPTRFLRTLMARTNNEPPPDWDGAFSLHRK